MRFMRFIIGACITLVVVIVWMFSRYTIIDSQPDSPKSRVVAYYQTNGRNALAIRVVLGLFHHAYPAARVHMYLDGMSTNIMNYLPLAKNDVFTLITSKQYHGVTTKALHFETVQAAQAYIKRLQTTAKLLPDGWVFLLEDDVWTWQAVSEEDLHYDISGTCWAWYRPEYAAVLKNRTKHNRCYGGYGGHFVDSSRLLGLSDTRMPQLIKEMLAARSPIASDELLSAVILDDGGTIGYYKGYYEKLTGIGPFKTHHQMKSLYGW